MAYSCARACCEQCDHGRDVRGSWNAQQHAPRAYAVCTPPNQSVSIYIGPIIVRGGFVYTLGALVAQSQRLNDSHSRNNCLALLC
jgi:hypothetical protein